MVRKALGFFAMFSEWTALVQDDQYRLSPSSRATQTGLFQGSPSLSQAVTR